MVVLKWNSYGHLDHILVGIQFLKCNIKVWPDLLESHVFSIVSNKLIWFAKVVNVFQKLVDLVIVLRSSFNQSVYKFVDEAVL